MRLESFPQQHHLERSPDHPDVRTADVDHLDQEVLWQRVWRSVWRSVCAGWIVWRSVCVGWIVLVDPPGGRRG
jgi:hypothetical protein